MERNDYSADATQSTSVPSTDGGGVADRARDIAGTAQEKLADAGSMARDRVGGLRDSVASALETGADKLKQRVGSDGGAQFAGATGSGVASLDNGRLTQASDSVAGGMKATADWLRQADIDNMRAGIEHQVKEHPGRTLMIAAGLGYLLGKAFRK